MLVDQRGTPLNALLSGANRPDAAVFAALFEGVRPIKRPRGRPRQHPDKAHADKAYDVPQGHAYLRQHRIGDRIARKRIESSARLGRYRWVAERTLAWLSDFRRLALRYDRRADIHLAFVHLSCALICLRTLEGRL